MTQGFPDSEECSKCEDEIGLTDVEGHYVGICKRCRDMDLGVTGTSDDDDKTHRTFRWTKTASGFILKGEGH